MSDILEELVTKFTYDVDQAGLNKYLRSQEKINRNTKTMIGLNTTLSKVMRRLFFGAGAVMGMNSLVQTYRNFDMVQRSLNALTGSAEEGAEHFEFLKRAALQTGTGLMEVAKAYRGYYYAAKTAGLTNEELQHSFLGVMVGARVLGANKQQVGGAMLALEQMLNKTTVQAQEMNLQLGNAISGAKEMAAEAMGMSVPEFVEKMQKKQIQSAEFVKKFGDYMYQTFIKKLPEAMKSLDANVINLQNAWLIFQHEIMKGGFGEELTKLTGQLMQFLLSPEAKSMAVAIGKGLNMIGKALELIIKHWKMILFLWGVNSLMSGIRSLYNLRQGIIDLAMDIGYGKHSLGGALDNIVYALSNILVTGGGLKSLINAIGKALIPLGRSMLWITAIGAVLYGIYLVLEDIFTYINHPEAQSFTKELAQKLPIIDEMIKSIKDTFNELSPILDDIHKIWAEIGQEFLIFIKENMPLLKLGLQAAIVSTIALGWALSWILKILLKIVHTVTKAISGIENLGTKTAALMSSVNPFGRLQMLGIVGTAYNEKIKRMTDQANAIHASGSGYMTQLGMPDYAGYNFNKMMTDNKTITNTISINAQDRSDAEIMAMLTKVLGGEIDNTQSLLGGIW